MSTQQAVRDAQARQASRRRRLLAYGQWQPFVDAEPVRRHVQAIRATGMSIAGIVKHTGVNSGTIDHLLYGKKPYPPAAKIRTENAQALLAYWPTLGDYDDGAVIDATGTRRRVQALAALGWPSIALHQHLNHLSHQAVERLRYKPRVTARTARAVRDLYDNVSEQDAENAGVTPWIANRTRNWARKFGYAPPIAWDPETIDDPAAHPDWTGRCGTDRGWWTHTTEGIPTCARCQEAHDAWLAERKQLPPATRFRELALAKGAASNREANLAADARELKRYGASHEQAAERLGVTASYLHQALKRHPEMAEVAA